jgi:kumamolisin
MPRKTTGHGLVAPVPPSEEMEVLLLLRGASDRNCGPHDTFALGKLPVDERPQLEWDELLNLNMARKADIQAVRRFASTRQLEVAAVNRGRRTMVLRGRVGEMNSAFGVEIGRYATGNLVFHSHEGPHAHPEELDEIVQGIFGLDNRPVAKRPRHIHFPPEESTQPPPPNPNTKLPSEFTRLYEFPKGATGKGQTIGVLEFDGGFEPRKLRSYLAKLGVAAPRVIVREIPPGGNHPVHQPGTLSSDVEVYMDLEILASVAPDATLVVYFAKNNARGWIEAFQTAIFDPRYRPSVLSVSWGQAEQYWSPHAINAIEHQLQLAGLCGITVCCSSGDRGVFEAGDRPYTVAFPASSPHVLACGGTILAASPNGGATEIVWNESRVSGVASGGGISALFDLPPFQGRHRVPARYGTRRDAGRGIPDVAANASSSTGYLIWADDTPISLGGTSAATPLWAGLIACLNEALGRSVGYLTPLLYSRHAPRAGALLDIRTGNNQLFGRQGYRARRGWDPCTGLGSPHGNKLLAWLQG